MTNSNFWQDLVAANRAGTARGIASWCTAHPETLLAILRAHEATQEPILIEATCNQVNQFGGYTGMTPADFRDFIQRLAAEAGVDFSRIILGGDHLGPNPWKGEPATQAMAKARIMVKDFVEAGFTKIHLDCSMACADDGHMSDEVIAARAADLCAVAENAGAPGARVYIIGTEVPIPGGETEVLDALEVTNPQAALKTYEIHRAAFSAKGVGAALDRVIALVVQPGVDMGNTQVFHFNPAKARNLSDHVHKLPHMVFEAHSTDFQTEAGLTALVQMHFPILKVGPALTFAYREAVVAMAAIEEALLNSGRSNIMAALKAAMDENPVHWRGYIARDAQEGLIRTYGLSDRMRYYWPVSAVQAALKVLTCNIDSAIVPPGLISQFVGQMLDESDGLPLSQRIVQAKVGAVVGKYRRASGQKH